MPVVCDPADRRQEGGLCLFQGRQLVIKLPAAAERLVQSDVLYHDGFLGYGVLILDREFLPLGIEDVQEVRKPAFVAFGC